MREAQGERHHAFECAMFCVAEQKKVGSNSRDVSPLNHGRHYRDCPASMAPACLASLRTFPADHADVPSIANVHHAFFAIARVRCG
eukprot:1319502-Pyramimonas_sp.AAC.1